MPAVVRSIPPVRKALRDAVHNMRAATSVIASMTRRMFTVTTLPIARFIQFWRVGGPRMGTGGPAASRARQNAGK